MIHGYDSLDNLTSVTDPCTLITGYQYNNLGDQTKLTSPDTGVTQMTPDAAGNIAQSKDARNKTANYTYDALNRVTQVSYSDQTINYQYDRGVNGKGRLSNVTDASGQTSCATTGDRFIFCVNTHLNH